MLAGVCSGVLEINASFIGKWYAPAKTWILITLDKRSVFLIYLYAKSNKNKALRAKATFLPVLCLDGL